MLETLIEQLRIPAEWIVVLISALPLVELRGAIPIGIGLLSLPWQTTIALAILGNILPVPFLLLFFRALVKLMQKNKFGAMLVMPALRNAERHSPTVEKYGTIGLMMFVAVPLPWTGAWTASMIASLLGFNITRAFSSIAIGVTISGVIVTSLVLLGWVGAAVAGAALILLAAGAMRRRNRDKLRSNGAEVSHKWQEK